MKLNNSVITNRSKMISKFKDSTDNIKNHLSNNNNIVKDKSDIEKYQELYYSLSLNIEKKLSEKNILEQKFNAENEKITEIKRFLIKENNQSNQSLSKQLLNLKNEIDYLNDSYNKTLSHIKQYREEINKYLKSRSIYDVQYNKLELGIKSISNKILKIVEKNIIKDKELNDNIENLNKVEKGAEKQRLKALNDYKMVEDDFAKKGISKFNVNNNLNKNVSYSSFGSNLDVNNIDNIIHNKKVANGEEDKLLEESNYVIDEIDELEADKIKNEQMVIL